LLKEKATSFDYDPNLIPLGKTTRNEVERKTKDVDLAYLKFNQKNNANFTVEEFIEEHKYDVAHPTPEQVFLDCNKYGYVRPTCVDELKYKYALLCFERLMILHISSVEVISLQEAKEHIKKSTAPGWPWNQQGYFSKQEVMDKIWDQIKSVVEKFLIEIFAVAWHISPKEELRPVEKLKQNKIRSFMSGPITLQLLGLQLFYQYNNAVIRKCREDVSFPFFVGDTKYYRGWDRLMRFLNHFPKGINTDVSQSDSSHMARILQDVYEIRFKIIKRGVLTPDEYENAQINFVINTIFSVLIGVYGDVLLKNHGVPSGGLLTLQDNQDCLYINMIYAWFDQDPYYNDSPNFSFLRFQELFRKKLIGDDSILTYPSGYINLQLWVGSYLKFGVKNNPTEYQDVKDLEFCSTKFIYNKTYQCWAPLMDSHKLESSLLLATRRSDKARWSFVRACALRVECWPDKQLSIRIFDFIQFMLKEMTKDMKEQTELDIYFTYDMVLNLFKTDLELDALYFGVEGKTIQFNCAWFDHIKGLVEL